MRFLDSLRSLEMTVERDRLRSLEMTVEGIGFARSK